MHNNYMMNNYWMNDNCNDDSYETMCLNVPNYYKYQDSCMCGFEEKENLFPTNPMLAQSYVPWQRMSKTFVPSVGLKMGTIFPELVRPYCPGQSMEEIQYIREQNSIKEGCNG